eukprot:3569275-Lingulodinium_polyedra.AAC.1
MEKARREPPPRRDQRRPQHGGRPFGFEAHALQPARAREAVEVIGSQRRVGNTRRARSPVARCR